MKIRKEINTENAHYLPIAMNSPAKEEIKYNFSSIFSLIFFFKKKKNRGKTL